MNTGGTLTTLYSFLESQIHAPIAELAQDTNGAFYGTTTYGGVQNCYQGCGGVFALSVGFGQFIETQPALATPDSAVRILGTSLIGATSVTFNGTAATFTVVSPSLITTTVPAGATTGTVQVVTPGGTLSSNVPFRVIQ
jgi:hypothetical protein